jgi:pimeloyl-ACP methyl ester carboxylesterase
MRISALLEGVVVTCSSVRSSFLCLIFLLSKISAQNAVFNGSFIASSFFFKVSTAPVIREIGTGEHNSSKMLRRASGFVSRNKWPIVAAFASFVVYAAATSFTPSPIATVAQIEAGGAHALKRDDGRVVEYFLHGAPLATAKCSILALHGAQTTGNLFSLLDDFAKDANVAIVAPTLPGYGLTTIIENPGSNSAVATWFADMDALLTELKLAQVHLLGTSLGSIFAARLAAALPAEKIGNVELMVAFAPATSDFDPLAGSILQQFAKMQGWSKRLIERFVIIPMLRLVGRGGDVGRSLAHQWEGIASCTSWIMCDWSADLQRVAGRRKVIITSQNQDAAAPPENQRRLHAALPGSVLITAEGPHEACLLDKNLFAKQVGRLLK